MSMDIVVLIQIADTSYLISDVSNKKGWQSQPFSYSKRSCFLFYETFDIQGLIAFRRGSNFKLNSIAFSKNPVSIALDIRIMDEYITRPIFFLDETIALLTIEPFYLTVDVQMSSFQALTPVFTSEDVYKGKPPTATA